MAQEEHIRLIYIITWFAVAFGINCSGNVDMK